MGDKINIAIMVGKQSNIVLNNKVVNSYRALNLKELKSIVSINDIAIIIIENIKEQDYSNLKVYIDNEIKNKLIYFKLDDSKKAESLGYKNYVDSKEMLIDISEKLGIEIDTYIRREVKEEVQQEDVVEDVQQEVIEEIQEEVIEEVQEVIEEVQEVIEEVQEEVEENRYSKIIKAIEDERDTYKSIIETIKKSSIEERVIDTEVYNTKLKQLDETIGKYNDLEAKYKESIATLNNITINRDELTDKYNSLIVELEKARLENENIALLKEEIDKLNKELSELNDTKISLDNEINTLKTELDSIKLAKNNLELNISTIKEEVDNLEDDKADLEREKSELEVIVSKLETANNSLEVALNSYKNTNEVYESDNKLLKANIDELEKLVDSLRADLINNTKSYEDKIVTLNNKVVELNTKCLSVDTLIAQARTEGINEVNLLKVEKIQLESNLEIIKSQLTAKEYQYNTLVQACGMDETGATNLLMSSKTLENINQSLRDQINSLNEQVENLNREKLLMAQSMTHLDNDNKQLKSTLNIITSGVTAGAGVNIPEIVYNSKSLIIPVFGSGSFGVTTTAVSIANALSKLTSVLYIDFDLVAPKSDNWFKNNAKEGLSVLIDKGYKYFDNYSSELIVNVSKSNKGRLDYIKGVTGKVDKTKVLSIDYSSFFKACAKNYNYIVIDLGKLGYSELNDKLIKRITDIASTGILVVNKDNLDIVGVDSKLREAEVSRGKLRWLLNLGLDTKMPREIKDIVGIKYTIMMFNSGMFNSLQDFTKVRTNKDIFNVMLQEII